MSSASWTKKIKTPTAMKPTRLPPLVPLFVKAQTPTKITKNLKMVRFWYEWKTKVLKKPLIKGFIVNWCRYPESTGTFYAISQSLILKAFFTLCSINRHYFTLDFKNFRTLFVHLFIPRNALLLRLNRDQFSPPWRGTRPDFWLSKSPGLILPSAHQFRRGKCDRKALRLSLLSAQFS